MAEKEHTQIILNCEKLERRFALLRNHRLEEYHIEREDNAPKPGSIYLGKIINLEPSLQAAFVDIGAGKNAFLHYHDMLQSDQEMIEIAKEVKKQPQDEDESSGKSSRRRKKGGQTQNKGGKAFELRNRAVKYGRKITIDDIPKLYPAGTEIMVQVVKGPIGTKGARLTTNLSIAGRFLVLMPYSHHIGLSTKIENSAERQRLRKILAALDVPDGMGLICRTVGEGRKSTFFKHDLNILLDSWQRLEQLVNTRKAPLCVYSEPNLIERTVRDFMTDDIDEIIVDSEPAYKLMTETLLRIGGKKVAGKIELYRQPTPVFDKFNVDSQLNDVMRREVKLPGGGYICVDETEALIAIDVNTGKGKRQGTDQPELILQTNLEAADEIARQLRLRNIGGLVVLDFIDMRSSRDRDEVYRHMKKLAKQDRAKTKVLPISRLGLMEMTRQREHESLLDTVFTGCPYCGGTGLVKSAMSMSVEIQRELQQLLHQKKWRGRALRVVMHPDVLERLRNEDASLLEEMERQSGNSLSFRSDPALHYEEFYLVDPESGAKIGEHRRQVKKQG